jgi:hypothetical protein
MVSGNHDLGRIRSRRHIPLDSNPRLSVALGRGELVLVATQRAGQHAWQEGERGFDLAIRELETRR